MGDLFNAAPAKDAVLSPCGRYRYRLTRSWDDSLPTVCWVMLNPSTADAEKDDPTIRRCVAFSRAWGCGGLVVVNLFAWRATDPELMFAVADDPVGPDNDAHIADASRGRRVIFAWGACPKAAARGHAVAASMRARVRGPECLGLTAGGMPRHPLYVKGDTAPTPYFQEGSHASRP